MPRELEEEEIRGLPGITVALTGAVSPSIKNHHENIKKIIEFSHIQYDALEEKDKVIVWKDYEERLGSNLESRK